MVTFGGRGRIFPRGHCVKAGVAGNEELGAERKLAGSMEDATKDADNDCADVGCNSGSLSSMDDCNKLCTTLGCLSQDAIEV